MDLESSIGPRTAPVPHPPSQRQLLWSMGLPNGRANRGLPAFQALLFPFNLMERSFVQLTIHCIPKNAAQSAVGLTVCCMRLASAIAAHAPGSLSVKKAGTRRNRVG